MKNLTEMKKYEKAVITKVTAKGELRERLTSFGITKGSTIELNNCNANRDNLEIDVDGVFVALRKIEAEKIEIGE